MNEEECTSYFLKKKHWTEMEKRILLTGLKKYGSHNIKSIAQLLPNKTENSVAQMIRKYKAIAELGKKEINSPLDVWLRSGLFDEDNSLVPEALLFIYLFENHPPPEETAGFDLKEIYKYLYQASKGHPSTTLSKETAHLFKKLIVTIDKEIWSTNECKTTDYLIGKVCTFESQRSYKRKRED